MPLLGWKGCGQSRLYLVAMGGDQMRWDVAVGNAFMRARVSPLLHHSRKILYPRDEVNADSVLCQYFTKGVEQPFIMNEQSLLDRILRRARNSAGTECRCSPIKVEGQC